MIWIFEGLGLASESTTFILSLILVSDKEGPGNCLIYILYLKMGDDEKTRVTQKTWKKNCIAFGQQGTHRYGLHVPLCVVYHAVLDSQWSLILTWSCLCLDTLFVIDNDLVLSCFGIDTLMWIMTLSHSRLSWLRHWSSIWKNMWSPTQIMSLQ